MKERKLNNIILLILGGVILISFNDAKAQILSKKFLPSKKIEQHIIIDGRLSESIWDSVPVAHNFVQHEPYNGRKPSYPTSVHVAYDNDALYLGAFMQKDSSKISAGLSQRDNWGGMTDYFGVWLSPFNDGINGFEFWVSAGGNQIDAKRTLNRADRNWDEVWQSATTVTDSGWIAEIRIPYSAIRFPKSDLQSWGINFWRSDKKSGEQSTWNYIDREVAGALNQSGVLKNLKDIKPPLRLSFMPYVSSYLIRNENGKFSSSYKGGMDIKYGINESFTLDMMLIPDFGQVQSDDEVLNLSPFETKYSEKRTFFTEGAELFEKADIFYSKRIGGTPEYRSKVNDNTEDGKYGKHFVIDENPNSAQMINATKISGRTERGLGIGVMNSMVANTYATLLDTLTGEKREIRTQPFTNYNVIVFDQTLDNNSYASLINTNYVNDSVRANVTGFESEFKNKRNTHALEVDFNYAYRRLPGERSGEGLQYKNDGFPLISNQGLIDSVQRGFHYSLEYNKISGNFRYGIDRKVNSDNYNINDLGYVRRDNFTNTGAWIRLRDYEPGEKLNRRSHTLAVNYNTRHKPRKFAEFSMSQRNYFQFKDYSAFRANVWLKPVKENNFYEPRVEGRHYKEPLSGSLWFSYNTDTRKEYVLWSSMNLWNSFGNNQSSYHMAVSQGYNISSRTSVNYVFSFWQGFNGLSYVEDVNEDSVFFGRRDSKGVENVISSTHNFTNDASLSFRLRHYWSEVTHDDQFFFLEQNGSLSKSEYTGDHDTNFNAFNIDMIFKWRFAPGSEMTLAWKNSISPDNEKFYPGYFSNFYNTVTAPQVNSISLKVLYYLDYLKLKDFFSQS